MILHLAIKKYFEAPEEKASLYLDVIELLFKAGESPFTPFHIRETSVIESKENEPDETSDNAFTYAEHGLTSPAVRASLETRKTHVILKLLIYIDGDTLRKHIHFFLEAFKYHHTLWYSTLEYPELVKLLDTYHKDILEFIFGSILLCKKLSFYPFHHSSTRLVLLQAQKEYCESSDGLPAEKLSSFLDPTKDEAQTTVVHAIFSNVRLCIKLLQQDRNIIHKIFKHFMMSSGNLSGLPSALWDFICNNISNFIDLLCAYDLSNNQIITLCTLPGLDIHQYPMIVAKVIAKKPLRDAAEISHEDLYRHVMSGTPVFTSTLIMNHDLSDDLFFENAYSASVLSANKNLHDRMKNFYESLKQHVPLTTPAINPEEKSNPHPQPTTNKKRAGLIAKAKDALKKKAIEDAIHHYHQALQEPAHGEDMGNIDIKIKILEINFQLGRLNECANILSMLIINNPIIQDRKQARHKLKKLIQNMYFPYSNHDKETKALISMRIESRLRPEVYHSEFAKILCRNRDLFLLVISLGRLLADTITFLAQTHLNVVLFLFIEQLIQLNAMNDVKVILHHIHHWDSCPEKDGLRKKIFELIEQQRITVEQATILLRENYLHTLLGPEMVCSLASIKDNKGRPAKAAIYFQSGLSKQQLLSLGLSAHYGRSDDEVFCQLKTLGFLISDQTTPQIPQIKTFTHQSSHNASLFKPAPSKAPANTASHTMPPPLSESPPSIAPAAPPLDVQPPPVPPLIPQDPSSTVPTAPPLDVQPPPVPSPTATRKPNTAPPSVPKTQAPPPQAFNFNELVKKIKQRRTKIDGDPKEEKEASHEAENVEPGSDEWDPSPHA